MKCSDATMVAAFVFATVFPASAQTWTDISTTLVNQLASQGRTQTSGFTGCAGVAVNRLNGDVYIKVIEQGIWKSSDKGKTYVEVSQGTVTGRDESGTAFTVDQNNPVRMAVFSLDGTAGLTADGTTWKKLTDMGRNWDFGSVDWGTTAVKVIMVCKHESGGQVYKTTDAGTTWQLLNITVDAQNNNDKSMIGVLDPTTFVYCNGSGIMRSTDAGATWTSVSTKVAESKYPVFFNGAHYVGTATGLLKSTDKGATWQTLGASTEVIQGPFFGATENTMVVVGSTGYFRTDNAGTTWTKIAALKPNLNLNFDPKWWGSYAWDPVNNIIYVSAMDNPAFAAQLAPVAVAPIEHAAPAKSWSVARNALFVAVSGHPALSSTHGAARFADLFDVGGHLLGRCAIEPDGSTMINNGTWGRQAVVIRAR